MRSILILAIIVMVPAAYLGFHDYTKYQARPGDGFQFSTIGEVWLDHDPAGFNAYKAEYKNQPKEWDENIRPYLDWNAFSTALTPALALDFALLLCWLLGLGPFKHWPESSGSSSGQPSGFARSSAADRGEKFKYKRR